MPGIAHVLISQSETIAGYKGKLSVNNSLLFGEDTFDLPLSVGDNSKMSALDITNLPAIGTAPFTIEYWVKFRNLSFIDPYIHENGQVIYGSSSITGGLAVIHRSNAVYVNNYLIGNNLFPIPDSAIPSQLWESNTWYHVAVSRNSSNQVTLHVNGYRSPAGAVLNVNNYDVPSTLIGTWRNSKGSGTTNNFIGHLFGYRINIGSNVYDPTQATIGVPKIALTSLTDTKLLMLSPTGNSLLNSGSSAEVVTKYGTVSQSKSSPYHDEPNLTGSQYNSSSPFSGQQSGCIRFFGSVSTYATYPPSSDFALGTGDFTIEWFSYRSDNNSNSTTWWYGTSSSPTYGISLVGSGADSDITFYSNGTSSILATISKSSIEKQWKHWALVRISGVLTVYLDGVALNIGGTSHTVNYSDSSSTFYMGKRGESSTIDQSFGGFFTNLRISKGRGLYSGNFTKPTGNLQRVDTNNPFGGTNTLSVRSDQVKRLLVP